VLKAARLATTMNNMTIRRMTLCIVILLKEVVFLRSLAAVLPAGGEEYTR
jgi:hypothetical protein